MLNPTTATAFVGRRRELEILSRKLDLACSGHGSVAMLVGEPGVGKTCVAQEFADRAAQRGAVVLDGCCFEGDWQPPYGPWVEALRRHARTSDPERLRDSLAGSAAYLAHLIPEVRAALPGIPLAESLGADDERLRFLDAVAQFLMASARVNVHVLVLDDLHWADRDSLLLLRHLARFLSQTRLLVVGAYRDTELDLGRRHPLADLLAVLRHETDYQHIVVHHMRYDEVSEFLAQAAGQPLPQGLAEAIYAETSGNPFYVREVFRHLVEEGKVLHRAGRWSTDTSITELGIPVGVRQVVERRVSRLSEGTGALLRTAAGFAGGFEFPLLQALTELTEDALLNCLDEALQAGLLRVTETPPASPTYHFAHAILRHTLYDSLKPDRRVRLHRRIALAMENGYKGHEQEHAAELAWQYWSSVSLPEAGQGLQYALAAAEQARRGFAPARAVSFLRMARDLAPDDALADRADVLGRLAVAEAEAFMLEDAQRSVEEALAARSASGAEPAVGAGLIVSVARALKQGGASPTLWEALVERGLALDGERRDLTWARLMLLRESWEQVSSGTVIAGRWLGLDAQAMAVARASGDEDDYSQTLNTLEGRTRAETEAVLALARTWRRPTAILHALTIAGVDFAHRHGAFAEAIECFRELLAAGKRYGSIQAQADGLAQLGVIQISQGDLALARETFRQAQEALPRLGAVHRLRRGETAADCCLAYYYEGDWSTLAGTAVQFATSPAAARLPIGPLAAAFAALAYARAGNPAEARRLLECFTPVVARLPPHNLTVAISCIVVWELEATEFADTYRRAIGDLVASGVGYLFLPHELGMARMEALLGRADEAMEHFRRTRDRIAADSYRPLRAIVDYDEALSLIRMGARDLDRIAPLLDQALADLARRGWRAGWGGRRRCGTGWPASRKESAPRDCPGLVS